MSTQHLQPTRGVADLRTLTGLADKRTPAYKAYLRISFLELERARHGQEIGALRRRLDFMTNRCREIDAETRKILASMPSVERPLPGSIIPASGAAAKPPRRRFQISY